MSSAKEGSTAFPKPLSPQGTGDVTALRCSEPLRSKDGGPSKVSPDCLSAGALKRVSKVSPDCAGWDRLADICLRPTDGLGATSTSSVNPASDMMPIKAVSIQWLSKHYDEIEEEPGMIVIDEAHMRLPRLTRECGIDSRKLNSWD